MMYFTMLDCLIDVIFTFNKTKEVKRILCNGKSIMIILCGSVKLKDTFRKHRFCGKDGSIESHLINQLI